MLKSPRRLILGFALAILIVSFALSSRTLAGLSPSGIRTLGLLAFTVILWASEAIHPAATSLLVFVLLPLLGILPLNAALATLGTETVWQLIGIYIIAGAITKWQLDRRLAYNLLFLSAGRPALVSLVFLLCGVFFTFLVPAPVGKVALLLPLAAQSLDVLGLPSAGNTGRATHFALGSISLFAGVGLLTGCPASLYAAQLMAREAGATWTYGRWFLVFFPPVLLTSLLLWPLLLLLYPPEGRGGAERAAFLAFLGSQVQSLGRMNSAEKKLALILGLMIGLWATGGYLHTLPVTLVCLMAAAALFLPGIELISWREAADSISWSIILVFSAGLALTGGLTETGAAAWLGAQLGHLLGGFTPAQAGTAAFLFLVIVRLGFTTPTAYAAALLPVAFAAAESLSLNPLWLGALTAVAAHTAFLYPMESMTLMTAYAASSLTPCDVLRAGGASTLLAGAVTLLAAYLYWPLLGLAIK
ncbi:MAG TPA: hypothetical protein GXX50_03135 [Firmicutes bacterium]|nr:hypothetical protein [Bacillota bacterium]